MTSPRSLWIPFLGLALAGCEATGQDVGRLLWPDQLHVTYETGENQLEARRNFDVDRQALLVGLSWDISTRNQGITAEDMRALLLELRHPTAPAATPVVATAAEPAESHPAEASAPVEPPPPEPEVVVSQEPAPEPVPEPAPAEPVAEVVPDVVPEEAPVEPPVEVSPPVETVVAETVRPVEPEVLEPVEPAPIQPPAPIVEAEGRALFGVVLLSALGVLVLALAIRLLPSLRSARSGR